MVTKIEDHDSAIDRPDFAGIVKSALDSYIQRGIEDHAGLIHLPEFIVAEFMPAELSKPEQEEFAVQLLDGLMTRVQSDPVRIRDWLKDLQNHDNDETPSVRLMARACERYLARCDASQSIGLPQQTGNHVRMRNIASRLFPGADPEEIEIVNDHVARIPVRALLWMIPDGLEHDDELRRLAYLLESYRKKLAMKGIYLLVERDPEEFEGWMTLDMKPSPGSGNPKDTLTSK